MRKIIIAAVTALAFTLSSASAQDKIKVKEKSAKKTPVWVGSSQTDYIVTSAIADDLETARNQCLDNVRRYIIQSVAENVKSTTEGMIDQKTIDNEIVSFLDTYTSTYESRAADVPFLKGISASKIEDYYWEKRENKTTGKVSYMYAVKYPFPSVQLKQLVNEFEKRDKEIWGRYLALAEALDNVSSVEEIDRAIADLGPVIDYLFDDTRRNEATTLRDKYRKLYDNISFREISNDLGLYKFTLVLDGRDITTSQRLKTSGDCATQIMSEQTPDGIEVQYNYDNCFFDDRNGIKVTFRLGSRNVVHEFFYTIKKHEVEIWPEQTAYLTSREKTDSTLNNIEIRIHLKSGHKNPYVIKSMALEVPGLGDPLFIDNLNTTVTNKEYTLGLTWIGEVELLKKQNNTLNMLKGYMDVEVPEEEVSKRVHFSLPFRANW